MSDAALNTATKACQSVMFPVREIVTTSAMRMIAEPIRKSYSYVNLNTSSRSR